MGCVQGAGPCRVWEAEGNCGEEVSGNLMEQG
jgi:hypothetical protein